MGYLFVGELFVLMALLSSYAFASDPSPLQDFCVATNDPKAAVFVNDKFCKDPMQATADDFFLSGLNVPGNTMNLVIREKFGGSDDVWIPKHSADSYGWGLWRGIINHLKTYRMGTKLKLGRGNRVSFWEDAWSDLGPLKVKFPKLWKLSSKKDAAIVEMVGGAGADQHWDLSLRRALHDHEISEATDLCSLLDDTIVNDGSVDLRKWDC